MAFRDGGATQWFVERRSEQAAAHDGQTLAALARERCQRLPAGPLTLLSTSSEGVALAGAIIALREDSTTWRHVSLHEGEPVEGAVAVVEAVRIGEGLRAALQRRFPGVAIMDGPLDEAAASLRAAA